MKESDFTQVSGAIVYIKDGTMHIECGPELSKNNYNYHSKIKYAFDGEVIMLEGYKRDTENISCVITEKDKLFDFYCEALEGFKDEIRNVTRFSWKNFKTYKQKQVWNSEFGHSYLYKEKYWKPVKYTANNWVIINWKEKNKS